MNIGVNPNYPQKNTSSTPSEFSSVPTKKITMKQNQKSPKMPDNIKLSPKAENLISQKSDLSQINETIGARPGMKPPSPSEMKRVDSLLKNSAKKHGIPTDTLRAVAWQESKWNDNAKSYNGQSKGIMQLNTKWHKIARTNAVWDAEQNINYGAKFLKELYNKGGKSWWNALKKFNGSSTYAGIIYGHIENKPWNNFY